jgi:hypothetical protein
MFLIVNYISLKLQPFLKIAVDFKTKTINSMTVDEQSKREGPVARAIEEQTAKIPSDVFLWAALSSMGVSLALKLMRQKHTALFVGQWAAPFLLLGIYNKLVKLEGHDQVS